MSEYKYTAKIVTATEVKHFPAPESELLAIALTSNNPASQSAPGKDRGAIAELALTVAPQLLDLYGENARLEVVTEEIDGEDMTVKTRDLVLRDFVLCLTSVVEACKLAVAFQSHSNYTKTTTKESGKRGRKAREAVTSFSLPA